MLEHADPSARKLLTVNYRGTYDGHVCVYPEVGVGEVASYAAIELRRPDGTIISTRVEELMMIPREHLRVVVLPRLLVLNDVPIGTEVWCADVQRR